MGEFLVVDETLEDPSGLMPRTPGEVVPLLESNDSVMRRLLEKAQRAATSDATILLTGESGTGKHVLAHQIHRWSLRAECPFVTINCTTHSEHLLESELFGHTRGAFDGAIKDTPGLLEAAHGGSIFLDEIADLSAPLQTKLLHFIKEQTFERMGSENTITVDTRIIAASNQDLVSEVAARRFREDLYYRLGVITLRVPALSERPGDVLPLTIRILAGSTVRNHRPNLRLSSETSSALVRYRWPGNIRELRNVIERAVVLCPSDVVTPEYLPDLLYNDPRSTAAPSTSLDDIEREHIIRVMAESPTLEIAANKLRINVSTLWRRRKRYGLSSTLDNLKN
ncbi:MAG: sigma-54 dependent transcriptional regulator [Candidatus Binatus sp.]|jgi:NtrC-family two-component system response regulator AlgB|uniref:sigma-54 interaction domain-containing protein n=1 Tax=Candidatus Binatus sp. TaxID=2811406 RepID=UPI003D0D83C4